MKQNKTRHRQDKNKPRQDKTTARQDLYHFSSMVYSPTCIGQDKICLNHPRFVSLLPREIVLAKVQKEGQPAEPGVKGISLFLVPRYLDDG
jgi:hypothetical protein